MKSRNKSRVVDGRLFIRLGLDPTVPVNEAFAGNASNIGHLASQLLLYDVIVIPTHDFGLVPTLIDWLGPKRFRDALEESTFMFYRRESIIGYAGNGNGLSGFMVQETEANKFSWWQETIFGDLEKSIELQLAHNCSSFSKSEKQSLKRLILANSRKVEYDNEIFLKDIVKETYTDIITDPALSNFVLLNSSGQPKRLNLERLEEVEPNSMKTSYRFPLSSPVDLVLRIADINMELLMGSMLTGCDLHSSRGADRLLRGKLARAGISPTKHDQCVQLFNLNGIPDVAVAISEKKVSISEIWDFRQKKISGDFRNWLAEISLSNARELEQRFVESLKESTFYESLPIRYLRVALTSAAGIINPAVGVGASFADSLIGRWIGKSSPKVFMDELQKLPEN